MEHNFEWVSDCGAHVRFLRAVTWTPDVIIFASNILVHVKSHSNEDFQIYFNWIVPLRN